MFTRFTQHVWGLACSAGQGESLLSPRCMCPSFLLFLFHHGFSTSLACETPTALLSGCSRPRRCLSLTCLLPSMLSPVHSHKRGQYDVVFLSVYKRISSEVKLKVSGEKSHQLLKALKAALISTIKPFHFLFVPSLILYFLGDLKVTAVSKQSLSLFCC